MVVSQVGGTVVQVVVYDLDRLSGPHVLCHETLTS